MNKKMLMHCATLALLGAAAPTFGNGVVVPIDLGETTLSFDLEGDTDNVVLEIDLGLGTDVVLDGIGWDMTLETIGESWASEASVALGDSAGNVAVYLNPAAGVDEPLFDAATYLSGEVVKLADVEIASMVLPDGILRIEFFESYDDNENAADARWLVGSTISVEIVVPDTCPADVNNDNAVDVDDLMAVILDWGTDGVANGTDMNDDGTVNVDDLIAVISAWGQCG